MIEDPFEYCRSTVTFVFCRIFSAKQLHYVTFPVFPIRTPHSAHFNSPCRHAVNNLSVLAICYQPFNAQFYKSHYLVWFNTNYEAPHYEIFSTLHLPRLC